MLNTQPPEKHVRESETLDLHSMFFTIQGEGPYTGHRSIFVRFAGCNLQCPGCDTEYTEGRRSLSPGTILSMVEAVKQRELGVSSQKPLIVVTGGEPFRQPIGEFLNLCHWAGYKVQIESNGMFAPDPLADELIRYSGVSLTVSPKTAKINARTAELADCFKYVLQAGYVDPDDGLPMFALEHFKGGRPFRPADIKRRKIFLNPFDEKDTVKNAENLAACAKSAMKHGYILGVQLHKLAGLE
ncbi:queuosine biosynthesis protein [Rhizobium phage RHph_X3_2]|nr:queuosine biosynthesis protein [Rhizobium phage RHph_X3_2]